MLEVLVFLVTGAFIFFAGLVLGLAIARIKEEDREERNSFYR